MLASWLVLVLGESSHIRHWSEKFSQFILKHVATIFRRGSRIQKGGGFVHQKGGFVQEFQERILVVAGSWANQQAKENCRQP